MYYINSIYTCYQKKSFAHPTSEIKPYMLQPPADISANWEKKKITQSLK